MHIYKAERYVADTAGSVATRRQWYLIAMLPTDGDGPIHGLLRKVAMREVDGTMIGVAHVGPQMLTVAGMFGAIGKPLKVPRAIYEEGVPVPDELASGGALRNAPQIAAWARANFGKLAPAYAREPGEADRQAAASRPVTPGAAKSPAAVRFEMDSFARQMQEHGLTGVRVQPGSGGWQGRRGASWVTQFSGSFTKDARLALAAACRKQAQGAAVVLVRDEQGGNPEAHIDFDNALDAREVGLIERLLAAYDVAAWTWANQGGRASLLLYHVGQWGDDRETHIKRTWAVKVALEKAGYATIFRVRPVRAELVQGGEQG